ncbi:MAG: short-chain dehydrogenase/reductase SDR [Hyphomonadaceae bacterium]|nr:MAG: short-chain dehydrogenase/reductase SDR [Hyphomonadaceae bacterium]
MRKTCLITGASAGIGAAFAELMAQMGYDLVLTARREDKLRNLAAKLQQDWGANSIIVVADLSQIGAVDIILGEAKANGRTIDALINNAGYGLGGTFASTNWQDQADFVQSMLTAPTELAHKVLGGMRERGFGRIINVASLAGILPGSRGHTLYSAIKAFLIKFSQSLHLENLGTGVHVSALCPGFTYSEFHDVNGLREQVSKLPNYMWLDAKTVAKLGYDAVEANKAVVVTGFANKVIAALAHLMPDGLMLKLMASQSKNFRNGADA